MVYTSLFKHLLLNNSLLLNSVINEYLLPYFHLVTQHDLYYTFDTTCDSDLSAISVSSKNASLSYLNLAHIFYHNHDFHHFL